MKLKHSPLLMATDAGDPGSGLFRSYCSCSGVCVFDVAQVELQLFTNSGLQHVGSKALKL